jgi:hypothetical protein
MPDNLIVTSLGQADRLSPVLTLRRGAGLEGLACQGGGGYVYIGRPSPSASQPRTIR